jgi:hypothetical protein
MKKIFIFLALLVALGHVAFATNESRFKLDETAIDAQFEQATDVTSEVDQLFINNELSGTAKKPVFDSKQQTAAVVALVQVITGIGALVPIHRFVLGTGGNSVTIFFAYFCTASGCGVGLILDTIFLFINFDETNYLDNSNVIMWKDDM